MQHDQGPFLSVAPFLPRQHSEECVTELAPLDWLKPVSWTAFLGRVGPLFPHFMFSFFSLCPHKIPDILTAVLEASSRAETM